MSDAALDQLKAANLFDMSGLTAVVAGGGNGLGLMMTVAMANNGAKVFILGPAEAKLKEVVKKYGKKGNIVPLAGQITSKEEIMKIVEQITEQCPKGINVLINAASAAGEGSSKSFDQATDAKKMSEQLMKSEFEEWEQILRINLIAPYFVGGGFLPLLAMGTENTPGYQSQIINVSSIAAFLKSSSGGMFGYQASKACVTHMTRTQALEYAPIGIRANQIVPGPFNSEMTLKSEDSGERSAKRVKTDLDEACKDLPAMRAGTEKDMASAILYLASYAGAFVNGQAIIADGGATAVGPSGAC